MAKEVIGTSPTTGEVLVRDTDTGDMSWEPGTEEQIASVTEDIFAAGEHGTVTYEEYQEPEVPVVIAPAVPPKVEIVYVAPTTLSELERVEAAETTGGYFGVEALAWIIERLNWISEYFYNIYLEVLSWVFPFYNAAYLFYFISALFSQLAWGFYSFSEWVNDTAAKVSEILSYWDIWSYFGYWLDRAAWAWDWVTGAFWNVWDIADDWWSSTRYTVQGWIDEAVSGVRTLVDQVTATTVKIREDIDQFIDRLPSIDSVISWWSNWIGNINTVLITWWTSTLLEIQGLINSAFIIRSDFWQGWQDWRDKVTEFFTDPEDWLYKAADRIIERFW